MVQVGDTVDFYDPVGDRYNALVTTVFAVGHPGTEGYDDQTPAINVVYVSGEESETDQYGRQIRRHTSVVHKSRQSAHGMYWDTPKFAG